MIWWTYRDRVGCRVHVFDWISINRDVIGSNNFLRLRTVMLSYVVRFRSSA